jgi:hypothetical protein
MLVVARLGVFLAFGVVLVELHELVEAIRADVVLPLVGLVGPEHVVLAVPSPLPLPGPCGVLLLLGVGVALGAAEGLLDHDLIGSAWGGGYWVTL